MIENLSLHVAGLRRQALASGRPQGSLQQVGSVPVTLWARERFF
jgi:hypothetical protein